MRQLILCATLRHYCGNAAMLALLLAMPFAVPQAHAAPNQVHLDRQPQTRPVAPARQARPDMQHRGMQQDMSQGMNHGMMNTADQYSDRAFLSGMIAHHEGAVQMAKQLLNEPDDQIDPKVGRWAEAIIEEQTREIRDMQAMLRAAGGMDKAAYQAMRQQMDDMMDQGQNLDPNVRFVALMIPHHAGAVEMALPALVYSDSRRIANLAQDIIEDQSEEIAAFRNWLSQQRHSL